MAFILSGFSDEIDENIDTQFKCLKNLGMEYFEVRGVNSKNIADLSEEEVAELFSKMEEYSIKASSIGSPIGKIGIEDDFDEHLLKLRRVIEIAKALGTRFIRSFSFYIPDGEHEKWRDEVIRRVSAMASLAEREGVILLHENEKGIWGDSPERCLELFREVNSVSFKGVFDPANFIQCGVSNVLEAYDLLKEHVVYFHIKDAVGEKIVPAGEGEARFPELLKILKEDGYDGFLSLEPHLGTFAGLEKLELSDDMLKLEKASEKTFILAYNSLVKIIERI